MQIFELGKSWEFAGREGKQNNPVEMSGVVGDAAKIGG